MRQKNSKETAKIPLQYFAYGLGANESIELKTQSEFLNKIKKWGFKTNPLVKIVKNLNEIQSQYSLIDSKEHL